MRRAALAVLFASVAAIALCYAAAVVIGRAPWWSVWVMAVATPLALIATIGIAVARASRGRALVAAAAAVTFLIVAGGFTLALLLPGSAEPLVLGLPRRAAVVLYAVGLLPLLVLPVAFALTFDAQSVGDDVIGRIREHVPPAHSSRPHDDSSR